MNISNQLLFFFSALGVFNGLLLVLFLWRADSQFLRRANADVLYKGGASVVPTSGKLANRFLSLMLLMICIRIGKSVFFFFSPDLSLFYLQIGLSACFLIGPFLYFFISASFGELNYKLIKLQSGALLALIFGIGVLYPYETYPQLWRELIFKTVNLTWLVYLILAWQRTYSHFKSENAAGSHLTSFVTRYSLELSVLAGNSLIWLSYYTSRYTSYIAGALSFSFITYLTLIVYFRQRSHHNENLQQKQAPQKYADKHLDEATAQTLETGLNQLMAHQKLFTDANLTLPVVAKKLGTNVPVLSQFLNDNLNTPFSQFVNEYRINAAKQLLVAHPSQSIEVIAEQCGFNSQSTFYTAFKKHAGTTPAKFRQAAAKVIADKNTNRDNDTDPQNLTQPGA